MHRVYMYHLTEREGGRGGGGGGFTSDSDSWDINTKKKKRKKKKPRQTTTGNLVCFTPSTCTSSRYLSARLIQKQLSGHLQNEGKKHVFSLTTIELAFVTFSFSKMRIGLRSIQEI